MCQPSGPGLTPGMSCYHSAITSLRVAKVIRGSVCVLPEAHTINLVLGPSLLSYLNNMSMPFYHYHKIPCIIGIVSRLIHWWGHLCLRFVPLVGHKSRPQLDAVGSAARSTL